jgi:hypothetical protein
LVELRVNFSAHELFHFYKAYQYIFDVFGDHADDISREDEEIIELMGSLFGDQIPVVGEIVNYRAVENKICSKNLVDDESEAEKLYIVGTLDPDMLWQEASNFLYEENEFTICARVPEPEIQDKWDPVKLTRVIKSIHKPVGEQLSHAIEFGLKQAKQEMDESGLESESSLTENRELSKYFDYIQDEYIVLDSGLSEQERVEIATEAAHRKDSTEPEETDIEGGLEVLKEIADIIEERKGIEIDREALSDFRMELIESQDTLPTVEDDNSEEGKYIEASFVAVYW